MGSGALAFVERLMHPRPNSRPAHRTPRFAAGAAAGFGLDEKKGKLERLKLPKGMTTMHLHANDGVLWSTGPKTTAWTEDGVKWNDITP